MLLTNKKVINNQQKIAFGSAGIGTQDDYEYFPSLSDKEIKKINRQARGYNIFVTVACVAAFLGVMRLMSPKAEEPIDKRKTSKVSFMVPIELNEPVGFDDIKLKDVVMSIPKVYEYGSNNNPLPYYGYNSINPATEELLQRAYYEGINFYNKTRHDSFFPETNIEEKLNALTHKIDSITKGFLVTSYKKGVKSINDSISGKNKKPYTFNPYKTKVLNDRAYYLGQEYARRIHRAIKKTSK